MAFDLPEPVLPVIKAWEVNELRSSSTAFALYSLSKWTIFPSLNRLPGLFVSVKWTTERPNSAAENTGRPGRDFCGRAIPTDSSGVDNNEAGEKSWPLCMRKIGCRNLARLSLISEKSSLEEFQLIIAERSTPLCSPRRMPEKIFAPILVTLVVSPMKYAAQFQAP